MIEIDMNKIIIMAMCSLGGAIQSRGGAYPITLAVLIYIAANLLFCHWFEGRHE